MKLSKKSKYTLGGIIVVTVSAVIVYLFWPKSNLPQGLTKTNGRLEMNLIEAATLYPGRIEETLVQEGDEVKKDDILVKMANTETQAQLHIAEAARQRGKEAANRASAETEAYQQKMNLAALDYQNAVHLRKEQLISVSELKKRKLALSAVKAQVAAAKAAIQEAKAAQQEAQANIDRIHGVEEDFSIKAPLSGRVESRLVEVGDVIAQGTKVVTILDYHQVFMNVYLSTASIANISLDDEARIVLDNINAVFPARIKYISSKAQFTPKYVETEAEREKMRYRVKLLLPEKVAIKYQKLLKNGLTGVAYVRIDPKQPWPKKLQVNLP